MAHTVSPPKIAGLASRFGAFVAERFPFALTPALSALDAAVGAQSAASAGPLANGADAIRALRPRLREALAHRLAVVAPEGLADATPRVSAVTRLDQAARECVDACDGFLEREAIAASLTADERLGILRCMLLARAADNKSKALFTSSPIKYDGTTFQGKAYRSLGQEAIAGAGIRLRHGPAYRTAEGDWCGDVISPLIRDLAVSIAFGPHRRVVREMLSAQFGKAAPPTYGKDFTTGDLSWGIVPANAPLATNAVMVAGLAMGFQMRREPRVAITFIGEGGSSLGEWHEAINLAAVRRLPAVFCVQNNQTALATPVREQSAVRVFADKAAGYGVPGITIDGTDPDAVAAAFTWAAERARAGQGPALIELVAMRMCGHAHHDDMLYLGRDPQPSWEYPTPTKDGYANREAYAYWSARDPLVTYAARLLEAGVLRPGDVDRMKADAEAIVDAEARSVIDAPWPAASEAGVGVFANEPPRTREEVLEREPAALTSALPPLDPGPPFDRKGGTFLDAITMGVGDALRADERVFIYGEDVGGKYGNAFLLLRPLLDEFGDRIVNSPISEAGILGACIGAALAGMRPIAEMQFNDFVATGFNQLVSNAAKIRYRWNGSVPMVVRMPWGGLRHAGPFHSQNTEAWFYRTPGLKIVVPSTPHDARALLASALADPDPVLYYEHIALYRDPRVKQMLDDAAPAPVPLGRAALRRAGEDLAIISYGAYVHVAMRVAERLAADGIQASVLDLRSLVPLDKAAVLAVVRHCNKVLIVHEDTRTGGIGESLAAIIQEEAFDALDAPIRIIGALDTPVPYSPPLEEVFLPSERETERAARLLAAY